MAFIRKLGKSFSPLERTLWCASVCAITLAFCLLDRQSYLTLVASLIGVTSLIFNSIGDPIGQALMVLFSLLYGVISFRFAYYGEMLTYVGMTMPMSLVALVTWLRHPNAGAGGQVKIEKLKRSEFLLSFCLMVLVTAVFHQILAYFDTANLALSTVSVATSFIAVYLTMRRSPYFALAYATNDIVLIALWALASFDETRYLSVVVCFVTFFLNDFYTFLSWRKMEKEQMRQANGSAT